MARSIATSIENNFVNGLVTEATALNFPEAAAVDTDNCVFEQQGNFTRRKGFEFEIGAIRDVKSKANQVVNTFLWQNAAGNGNNNFVVRQVGAELAFFKVTTTGALSANKMSTTVNLNVFKVAGSDDPGLTEAQFTYGRGYLFVTHPTCEPFYIEFNTTTNVFNAYAIDIQIRDFEGVDDFLRTEDRPGAGLLTGAHLYNLYNQGWRQTVHTGNTALLQWQTTQSNSPSNADVWWQFKNATEQMDSTLYNSVNRGNSPAPKGSFILDAFYLDRAAAAATGGIAVVTSGTQRPSTTAFFASRVFYAGVQAQNFSNKIYYTQIIEGDDQFGHCYQTNDPTSEYMFDLLPSDGGVISILECGTIVKLMSIQSALLVFATNGVWAISGSTGTGFAANDYTVKKIASVPALTASSFVDAGGVPIWWNSDGIYTISSQDALGNVGVTSISEKKIKDFYNNEIPASAKSYAKGFFNSLDKVIHWAYRSTDSSTVDGRYQFDRILVLNTISGAFYPWSVSTSPVTINGLIAVQGLGADTTIENVVDSLGANVTTLALENVQTSTVGPEALASVFKYLVSIDNGGTNEFTFAENFNESYKDWISWTGAGIDYSSYAISGYRVRGDAQRRFQSNYIMVFADIDDPGIFDVQGIWDYATSGSTGDFTSKQRCTFTAASRRYNYRKLKIRGMGLSVQFKFSSVSGEPFNITGWSVFESSNASI
jgi:hypothetical protein